MTLTVPTQYRKLDPFIRNYATNVNKIITPLFFPYVEFTLGSGEVSVGNNVVPGSNPTYTNTSTSITISTFRVVINNILMEVTESVTLNLNNSSHYFDTVSSNTGSKDIWVMVKYDDSSYGSNEYVEESSRPKLQIGLIYDISTYTANSNLFCFVYRLSTSQTGTSFTDITDIYTYDDTNNLQNISLNFDIIDCGWLEPVPDGYEGL